MSFFNFGVNFVYVSVELVGKFYENVMLLLVVFCIDFCLNLVIVDGDVVKGMVDFGGVKGLVCFFDFLEKLKLF